MHQRNYLPDLLRATSLFYAIYPTAVFFSQFISMSIRNGVYAVIAAVISIYAVAIALNFASQGQKLVRYASFLISIALFVYFVATFAAGFNKFSNPGTDEVLIFTTIEALVYAFFTLLISYTQRKVLLLFILIWSIVSLLFSSQMMMFILFFIIFDLGRTLFLARTQKLPRNKK